MITNINNQLNATLQRLAKKEREYHRPPHSVKLIAVSKTRSIVEIEQAIRAGQTMFAENYLQEALTKIKTLDHYDSLEWHFIGHIQANKTKLLAQNFAWIHSIDRFSVAKALSQYRSPSYPLLNICIQVNISEETSKSGISLAGLPQLAKQITTLPNIKLRGLMVIPKASSTISEQRKPFRILRLAMEELNKNGFSLDTLSMGMSNDYEAAIAEGATHIRLGTAIFGIRERETNLE